MNLLFDLGGVIIDIRRQNCVEAFQRLGFADIESFLGDYGQKGPFLALEEGAITPEEFRSEIRAHIPAPVSDAEIDAAFNRFITGIPTHRLRTLEQLRAQGHRLYVISNTNPIMWNSIIASEFAKDGHNINHYFHGVVTSFEARACKPHPAIFHLCEERFGILPEETIFFDDSAANCDAANALGFRSIHVPPGTEFASLLPPA